MQLPSPRIPCRLPARPVTRRVKHAAGRRRIGQEVEKTYSTFLSASVVDAVWWGAEAKTNLKVMRANEKEIGGRLKLSIDLEEIKTLGKA